ncbi:MAG: lysylphosphatidylglycerol synthase domain-containing protein [Gemmatimonadales bacterium]
MTTLLAHAICAALVAADLGARTIRLRWLIAGTGQRLGVAESLRTNLFADAGATLTPMRLGGEPARLASLRLARIPLHAIGVALSYEILTSWSVLVLVGAGLAWRLAGRWLAEAGPALAATAVGHRWAIIAVLALSLLAIRMAHRLRHRVGARWSAPLREAIACWREMPAWTVAASAGLSLVNIATRTALLPVLVLSLPDPPQLPTLVLGSFLLVYGQLFLPTPAGAGAVELGLLGGAAGTLGGQAATVLLAWRWWASGMTTLLGLVAAVRLRGWRDLFGRDTPPSPNPDLRVTCAAGDRHEYG